MAKIYINSAVYKNLKAYLNLKYYDNIAFRHLRTLAAVSLLAASALITACEPVEEEQPEFVNGPIPEGTADIRGTWYEDGSRRNGGHSGWNHIRLRQNGKETQGNYEFEDYDPYHIRGFVDGNNFFLQTYEEDYTPMTIEGIIQNSNKMKAVISSSYPDGTNRVYFSHTEIFNRISTNLITNPLVAR